jgi:hypothetical protein
MLVPLLADDRCPIRHRPAPERLFPVLRNGHHRFDPAQGICEIGFIEDVLVPILRARSLPSRIQRRIVSGFRPARRAASGPVTSSYTTTCHRARMEARLTELPSSAPPLRRCCR